MAANAPFYRLYASNGTTLVYEFENTQNDEGAFTNPQTFVEHDGVRGIGSVTIPGTDAAFDITLTFILFGVGQTSFEKYSDLQRQMQEIEDTIIPFTPYILSIETDESGSSKDYNVLYRGGISFPLDSNTLRVNTQHVILPLRCRAW